MFFKERFFSISIALIVICFFFTQARAGGEADFNLDPFSPLSIKFQFGVMPTSHSGISNSTFLYKDGTTSSFVSPKFSDQSYAPINIGIEPAYALNPLTEVFLELVYTTNGKRDDSFNLNTRALTITQTYEGSSQSSAYLGARRYFNLTSANALPYIRPRIFIGAKLGATHRASLIETISFAGATPIPPAITAKHYNSDNAFSGGIQLGLDYRSAQSFAVGILAEVIRAGGRKGNLLVNPAPFPNIQVGNVSSVYHFPISIYVKLYPEYIYWHNT
jgi:hypothetical protein